MDEIAKVQKQVNAKPLRRWSPDILDSGALDYRPRCSPGFFIAQLLGAAAATAVFRWLVPPLPTVAGRVVDRLDQENEP